MGEWKHSFTLRPLYLRGKSAGIHWIGGWVNPRTGLDSTPQYVFMAWRLVKNRENFTLLLSHLLDFRNRIQAYTCLF